MTKMTKQMVILVLALLCASAIAVSSQEPTGNTSINGLASLASTIDNSTDNSIANSTANSTANNTTNSTSQLYGLEDNVTQVNLDEFAEEHPLDPEVGILLSQVASSKNATVNFGQVLPGGGQRLHYHKAHDEIIYIIRGEGFMTIAGQNRSIKASDLIYVPANVIHNNSASGSEAMEAITIYVPGFDGKDKIFV